MPKKGIHPKSHLIKVKFTDGNIYEMMSTWGKEGDILQLDIDPLTHVAWTGQRKLRDSDDGRLAKYKKRYEGL